ncbi:MAG: carbamoyltransferase HypF [Pseudomonadota bacterium]
MNLKRVRIKVTGIVQGVGFRPTTYKYAHEYGVTGYVVNTSQGVTIEAEAEDNVLNDFINRLFTYPPRMSKVTGSNIQEIPVKNETEFLILRSEPEGEKVTDISPDIAVCDDCVKDILDKTNRRYLYPFTNCTNCGPRFTIIQDRPYDRRYTSMSGFKMCTDCEKEYNDPSNRRFHAQPNACPKCGPKLGLLGADGDPITETVKLLKSGKVVAVKGLGGFNIACDPFNNETVSRLRRAKKRGNKPFALMMKDIGVVRKYCVVSESEQKLLLSMAAPIVLLRKKDDALNNISPDNNYLGVMLPYTPLHKFIFSHVDALIMTSANKIDDPIAISDAEVNELIKDKMVDVALTNDRDIVHRCDDSISAIVNGDIQMIRRARGFVPSVFEIAPNAADHAGTISLGAELKNTFSVRIGNKIYMSQHIGDMDDIRNYDYQKEQINDFLKLLNIKTKNINIDMHPGYKNYDDKYNKIQHHHSHALSVMGEHGLLGKDVLCVICDGTGYGADGNIWGFEFLKIGADYKKFERLSHLQYFPLPGGEKAINEVDRLAVSVLKMSGLNTATNVSKERFTLISSLIDSGINCPLTSSLGRLFDAVAALCGVIKNVEYEAQAAILLQKYAEEFKGVVKTPYTVTAGDVIDFKQMIRELNKDMENKVSVSEIAYKFHVWVAGYITQTVKGSNGEIIALSGGCFQNKLLSELVKQELNKNGYTKLFFNNNVPINDAGVSFGQALI